MAVELIVKAAAEFVGTTFFLAVILLSGGHFLWVAAALALAIFLGGDVSGGHFNPAVTTMMLARNNIDITTWLVYVASQISGGLAATAFVGKIVP